MTNFEDNFDSKKEIELLKDNFEPHNLSKKICEAIKNQVDINLAIQEIIKKSLKDDITTQETIKSIIDKHITYKSLKWILGWIMTIILAIIGGKYFK